MGLDALHDQFMYHLRKNFKTILSKLAWDGINFWLGHYQQNVRISWHQCHFNLNNQPKCLTLLAYTCTFACNSSNRECSKERGPCIILQPSIKIARTNVISPKNINDYSFNAFIIILHLTSYINRSQKHKNVIFNLSFPFGGLCDGSSSGSCSLPNAVETRS
jgi:hypothetical protein